MGPPILLRGPGALARRPRPATSSLDARERDALSLVRDGKAAALECGDRVGIAEETVRVVEMDEHDAGPARSAQA